VTLHYREMAFSHQNNTERMFISLIMSRCFVAYHVDFSLRLHLPFNPVTQCSAASHRNLTNRFPTDTGVKQMFYNRQDGGRCGSFQIACSSLTPHPRSVRI
jgi:hypothetical protein